MRSDQIIGQCDHGRQTLDNLKDPCPLCVAESKPERPARCDPARDGLEAIKSKSAPSEGFAIDYSDGSLVLDKSGPWLCIKNTLNKYLPAIETAIGERDQLRKVEASRDAVEKVLGYFPAHDQWGEVVAGHITELDAALKAAETESDRLREWKAQRETDTYLCGCARQSDHDPVTCVGCDNIALRDRVVSLKECLRDADKSWTFDQGQQHTHTWHDREDWRARHRDLLYGEPASTETKEDPNAL